MQRLVLATHNPHKTHEIRKILGDVFPEITDLTGIPEVEPPEEVGNTLEENARLKARTASERLAEDLILADDSGLEVDALGGAPGVHSARFAGPDATDEANRQKLLRELDSSAHRTARFRCVLALARNREILHTCCGTVGGTILPEPRGEGGFGYDPLFVPVGYTRSFAELPAPTKNALSHRGNALRQLRRALDMIQWR